LAKSKQVLRHLRTIWGRPVHLQARVEDEHFLLTCDEAAGESIRKEKISASTSPPAHLIR
ncbi:MAG: hypothetical protein K2Q20_07510, partial [Phycisphaerales bacterium]|nr:hypothetical protein [Phycisphaerales bacterium]